MTKTIHYYFFIITFLFQSYLIPLINCKKIISFECLPLFKDHCVLSGSFGKKLNKMNIPIDLKYLHTWINRNYFFQLLPSAKLLQENIAIPFEILKDHHYSHKIYNGRLYEDVIELRSYADDNENITNVYHFPTFHYAEIGYYQDESIALGLGYDDQRSNRNDFLKAFINEKLIDHYSFALTIDLDKRYLHLGGIPFKYTSQANHYQCKVKGINKPFWDCLLNKIYFMNDSFNVDKYATFDNRNDFIFAPRLFIEYLTETYFKEGIDNKECLFTSLIFCKENYINSLTNFIFMIDDNKFIITPKELFHSYPDYKRGFMFMIRDNYENSWVLGKPFINKYNTFFDYKNQTIHFYSNDNKKIIPYKSNPLIQKTLLISNILLVSFGSCIMSYVYYSVIV